MSGYARGCYYGAPPEQKGRIRHLVYDRDGGKCGVCGEPVDFATMHVDHIVPLARGGEDAEHNLQAAHPICNRIKGAKGDAPLLYPPRLVRSDGSMMLSVLAARLGIKADSLRVQIARHRLAAYKFGRDWFVTDAEAARYEREQAGKKGTASPRHSRVGNRKPRKPATPPADHEGDTP